MTHDDEIEVCIAFANDEAAKGNLDTAEYLINQTLATESISPSHRAKATIALANLTFRRGDFEQALSIARTSLGIVEEYCLASILPKCLHTCGNVTLSLGAYDLALQYFEEALSAYDAIGQEAGVASITGNIGIVYFSLGMNDKALEFYDKALAVQEKLGQQSEVANVKASIGNVYYSLGSYDNAREYYTQALLAYQALGQKTGVAGIMGNLGNVYKSLEKYEEAREYFAQALAANEEVGRKSGIAHTTGNIGNLYAALGAYEMAYEYYSRALSLFIELAEKSEIANLTGSIGVLYANKEFDGYDTDKAEESFLSAIALFEDIGVKRNLYEVHKSLADLYETQKRWEEHSIQFKKYHTLKEEVQSQDAHKQAGLMEQRRQAAEREKEIAIAKAAADAKHQATQELLHNVLPPSIAHRMVDGEKLIAEKLPSVSVLFADIVGFTKLSQRITAEELVEGLDRIFSSFDILAEKHGLEKIKTIGDAYMVVSGAPEPRTDHAEAMAQFALDMLEAMKEFTSKTTGEKIQLRIGIHSGEVVAGVIGKKKFAYDLWGDAVNTASRMESHGEAGKIHVSEEFAEHLTQTLSKGEDLQDSISFPFGEGRDGVSFTPRGEMEIKGKGKMRTFFLQRSDGNG